MAKSNYDNALNQAIKNGVSKNQWVTWTMVGLPALEEHPEGALRLPEGAATSRRRSPKKNYLDIPLHTNSGTVIDRYEEVALGKWKKIAELTVEQAARDPEALGKETAPDTKKG